jgi:hypothetical protein
MLYNNDIETQDAYCAWLWHPPPGHADRRLRSRGTITALKRLYPAGVANQVDRKTLSSVRVFRLDRNVDPARNGVM